MGIGFIIVAVLLVLYGLLCLYLGIKRPPSMFKTLSVSLGGKKTTDEIAKACRTWAVIAIVAAAAVLALGFFLAP